MARPLTPDEEQLIRWMLANGTADATEFTGQVDRALASEESCACGCASVDLVIEGLPAPTGGMHILADFVFDNGGVLSGAFLFEQNGVLAGLEVYGLAADAPKRLPRAEELRLYGS